MAAAYRGQRQKTCASHLRLPRVCDCEASAHLSLRLSVTSPTRLDIRWVLQPYGFRLFVFLLCRLSNSPNSPCDSPAMPATQNRRSERARPSACACAYRVGMRSSGEASSVEQTVLLSSTPAEAHAQTLATLSFDAEHFGRHIMGRHPVDTPPTKRRTPGCILPGLTSIRYLRFLI